MIDMINGQPVLIISRTYKGLILWTYVISTDTHYNGL